MRTNKKVASYKVVLACCSCTLLLGCQSLNKEPQPSSEVNDTNQVVKQVNEPSQNTPAEILPSPETEAKETENESIFLFTDEEKDLAEPINNTLPETGEAETNTSGYLLNFDAVFELALSHSKEYLALGKEVDSKTILKEKEEKYFYPKAYLSSETTKYYGTPVPDSTLNHDYILKLDSKLYGSAIEDKIAASKSSLDAGIISLEAQEISVYYTVLKYLTKIELTREYEKAAEQYRKEIEIYYLRQVNSSNQGVSTQTDAMEAKLAVAEFDESVYSVVSNIEQYFRKLSEETGIDLELDAGNAQEKIGVDYSRLEPLLGVEIRNITAKELLESNADLRRTQKTLKSTLHSAKSTRERFTVELTSESHLLMEGDSGESTGGDTDESYVQLNMELDLYDHATQSDKDSAVKMYEAEKLRFDKQFKQAMDQFKTNLTNYNQQKTKRQKTADQVDILAELIENQKEEIYTDQVTYKDIVESISKLNNAKKTLLDIELNLFDTLYDLKTLKSEKIL